MTYEEILEAMRQTYLELAGLEPDDASDIGIRLKVLAGQLELAHSQLDLIEREMFPQTSAGTYLDMHAAQRGLARKAAISAKGVLRFSRGSAAQYDILILAGILCSTRQEDPLQVETTEDGVLAAGELSVDIPARSRTLGSGGNLAAGQISVMITPAQGISSVEQHSPFTGGVDEETDEELRQRLLAAYRVISNGANSAFYYDLAMKREGVVSAAVLPRIRGRGTVDVAISAAGDADVVVSLLQSELDEAKEINVDVLVRQAEIKTVDISLEVDPTGGGDAETVLKAVEGAVQVYLEELAVGESLRLAMLTGHLLAVDGVYNLHILAPAGDVRAKEDQVLRPGTVQAQRMEVTG